MSEGNIIVNENQGDKMIQIKNRSECCGCCACAVKCPQKCIQMVSDSEGFIYPYVNGELCINCGLCEKTCPVLNCPANEKIRPCDKTYVSYCNVPEIRLNSSSGGIFSLCAEQILKKNGVVFGAAFDCDFSVHHIKIEKIDDIKLLQGSKYVQSKIENTFEQVRAALCDDKYVLYSGTACQISALKQYLAEDFCRLYTVDVLCHGVPSPLLWKKYLEEKETEFSSKIKNINFRDKSSGWKSYSVKIEFLNGKVYSRTFDKDVFMRLFLSNICLRPSCHDCKFKSADRMSDITVGDAWGIGKCMPDMDDDMGTSVVIVHSGKGKQLAESITDRVTVKSCDTDIVLPPDADSRKSVMPHRNRQVFFRYLADGYGTKELAVLIKKPLSTRFKAKIIKLLRSAKRLFRIKIIS